MARLDGETRDGLVQLAGEHPAERFVAAAARVACAPAARARQAAA